MQWECGECGERFTRRARPISCSECGVAGSVVEARRMDEPELGSAAWLRAGFDSGVFHESPGAAWDDWPYDGAA